MCYDIKVLYETALKKAKRKNDPDTIKRIEKELLAYKQNEYFHVTGHAHPKIPIYTNQNPDEAKLLNWGLIPGWVKDETTAKKLHNSTLNARIESLFEKPAFRKAAKRQHCLIFVDGFYEHYHYQNKTYPHFIHSKKGEELCLAGLWDEWVNPETGEIYRGFSIVTTQAAGIMKKIHNNPKLKEARMPLILTRDEEDFWLKEELDAQKIAFFLQNRKNIDLEAYTVNRLRGKYAIGNVAEVSLPHIYPELTSTQESLF
jgi:putative SOS response-associated peptidase YedK